MNRDDINREFKKIDESYKNSFNKVRDINGLSDNMASLWGNDAYNDFAQKMQSFTEDMIELQNVFDEYENSVSEITKVSDKIEDYYGKRR